MRTHPLHRHFSTSTTMTDKMPLDLEAHLLTAKAPIPLLQAKRPPNIKRFSRVASPRPAVVSRKPPRAPTRFLTGWVLRLTTMGLKDLQPRMEQMRRMATVQTLRKRRLIERSMIAGRDETASIRHLWKACPTLCQRRIFQT